MKIHSAEFIKSCFEAGQLPRDRLPEIAFVGRSNVGKSSLINSLLTRKHLAKISRTPGKTRALNVYRVVTSGPDVGPWYAVDLPGYGYAKVSKSVRLEWGPMIEAYLRGREALRGVLLLVDSRGVGRQDRSTLEWLRSLGLRAAVIATKIDKLSRAERRSRLSSLRQELGLPPEADLIPYSALTHEGRNAVWAVVQEMAGLRNRSPAAPP